MSSIVPWHPTLPCRLPSSRPRLCALDDGASPHAASLREARARVPLQLAAVLALLLYKHGAPASQPTWGTTPATARHTSIQ